MTNDICRFKAGEEPWGQHGALGVEEGALWDLWRYEIHEPLAENSKRSGWYQVTLMRPNPKYVEGRNTAEPVASGLPLMMGFRSVEAARAAAYGYLTGLRYVSGYPDPSDIKMQD